MSQENNTKNHWTENPWLYPVFISIGFFTGLFISKGLMGVEWGEFNGVQTTILVSSVIAGMVGGIFAVLGLQKIT